MNKKGKACSYWIAVLLVGLALGVIAGLAIAGFAYPIYQSEKWAAWVQAFGSVGAIFIAIWVANYHSREQLKKEVKSTRDKSEGAWDLLCQSLETALNSKKMFDEEGGFYVAGVLDMLNVSIAALEKIPLHTPPYTELLHEIGQALLSLQNMRRELEKLLSVSEAGLVGIEHKEKVNMILDHYITMIERKRVEWFGEEVI